MRPSPTPPEAPPRLHLAILTMAASLFLSHVAAVEIGQQIPVVDGGETSVCVSRRPLGPMRGSECLRYETARRDLSLPTAAVSVGWPVVVSLALTTWAWGRGPRRDWLRWGPRASGALAVAAVVLVAVEAAAVMSEAAANPDFGGPEVPPVMLARLTLTLLTALALGGVWGAQRHRRS